MTLAFKYGMVFRYFVFTEERSLVGETRTSMSIANAMYFLSFSLSRSQTRNGGSMVVCRRLEGSHLLYLRLAGWEKRVELSSCSGARQ